MEILSNYQKFPDPAKGSVMALGNFDGVHLGHQSVINFAKSISRTKERPLSVMTFEPHPITILKEKVAPFRLTNPSQKERLIAQLGVDYLCIIPFGIDFAKISAEDFVTEFLLNRFQVDHIVIGYDFIFGHNRKGDADLLKQMSSQYGFGFSQAEPIIYEEVNQPYSSTYIRQLLQVGAVQEANSMLGHPFTIEGKIIKGKQLGRRIGYPTANIKINDYIYPKFGVYAVNVKFHDRYFPGVANIGIRPTFHRSHPLLEVHIFDFSHNMYGEYVEVELFKFLRPERMFNDAIELKNQISADCQLARDVLWG